MQTINARTIAHLADRLAPQIAERLAVRPRPGELVGGLEDLLNERQAAVLLNLRPATLTKWRNLGRGPIFRRLGPGPRPAVRYLRADVLAFRDRGAVTPGGR